MSGTAGTRRNARVTRACLRRCCRKGGTFRSVKNVPVGAKGLTLKQHIEHTLGTGAVEDAVRLPPGEDMNEWLAVNTGALSAGLAATAASAPGLLLDRAPVGLPACPPHAQTASAAC
jgi:hypothetical protein